MIGEPFPTFDGKDSGEKDSDNKATHATFTAVGNTITLDKEIVIFNTRSAPYLAILAAAILLLAVRRRRNSEAADEA